MSDHYQETFQQSLQTLTPWDTSHQAASLDSRLHYLKLHQFHNHKRYTSTIDTLSQRANRSLHRNYPNLKSLSSNQECPDSKNIHAFVQFRKLKGDQSTSRGGNMYHQLKIKSVMILDKQNKVLRSLKERNPKRQSSFILKQKYANLRNNGKLLLGKQIQERSMGLFKLGR